MAGRKTEEQETCIGLSPNWRLQAHGITQWALARYFPNTTRDGAPYWKAVGYYDRLVFLVRDYIEIRLRTCGARTAADLQKTLREVREEVEEIDRIRICVEFMEKNPS